MSFLDELVRKKIIEQEEIPALLERINTGKDSLDDVLLARGLDEDTIMQEKASYYNIPARALKGVKVSPKVLAYIPEESAKHYSFVPIEIKDSTLEIGIVDSNDLEAMDALQFISTQVKMPLRIFLVSPGDLEYVLSQYEDLHSESEDKADQVTDRAKKKTRELLEQGDPDVKTDAEGQIPPGDRAQRYYDKAEVEKELNQDLGNTPKVEDASDGKGLKSEIQKELARVSDELPTAPTGKEEEDKTADIVEETPVSKMVAVILRHAAEGKASDIHIEHTGDQVRVRFRIDGELHTSLVLPVKVHAAIVSRIKILSSLKLDEKRKPQDGRFSATIEDRRIDFRVSTYPAYYGEKVVMRLLDTEGGVKSLSELGIRDEDYEKVKEAISRPYGMILLTGPTGSGKSTTLYSMLNELDKETDNVVSLEDPVEYHMEGVSQSNVRPDIGYTFATGLRSILRQDPDVIMVGEIRDKETAELAIQAALTGHLVLSTLHTNSAAGVVPRLVDMGVDPYLIAPTLIMAIGQRLSAALCEDAKKKVPMDEVKKAMVDQLFDGLPEKYRKEIKIPEHTYEAGSSSKCPSGVRGRQAVFEVMKVGSALQHTILTNPVETEVFQTARKDGMLNMKEDALLKSFEGLIPYVEVNKL